MIFKRIHKWVSLVVFIQLLIWLSTGFLLGKVDHNKAAGKDTFVRPANASNWTNTPLLSVNSIFNDYPLTSEIKLLSLIDKPVYRLKMSAGPHAYQASDYTLIDAVSGAQINFNNAALAMPERELLSTLALSSYLGSIESVDSQLIVPPIEDLPSERNPVWQVNVQDASQTSIYIRANTGEVIGHVNNETRWRTLLMMLHFMDYQQVGSFNNIFIKIFALLTLLLSGTGLWWLASLIRDKQLKLVWFSGKRKLVVRGKGLLKTRLPGMPNVSNSNSDPESSITLTGSTGSSLLNVLLDNQVRIQAVCGGGGVCGTCRFKSNANLCVTEADAQHLNDDDIESGYRLACQHVLSEVSEICVDRARSRGR